jgi:hypothetical protein
MNNFMKIPFRKIVSILPALLLAILAQCSRTADTISDFEYIPSVGGIGVGTDKTNAILASPATGQTDVPLNSMIVLVFNYPVDRDTPAGNISFNVTVNGTVSGSIPFNDLTASGPTHTLDPSTDFQPLETITVTANVAIVNSSGIQLEQTYSYSFQAGDNTIGPSTKLYALAWTQYPPAGPGVSVDIPYVELTFSKSVALATMTTASFAIIPAVTSPVITNPAGNTWRITWSGPLQYDTPYNVRAYNTITDTSGNALVEEAGISNWTFTTENEPGAPTSTQLDDHWTENPTANSIDVYFSTTSEVDISMYPCYIIYQPASMGSPTVSLGTPNGGYLSKSGAETNWDGGSPRHVVHMIQLLGVLTPQTSYNYRMVWDLNANGNVDAGEYSGEFTLMSRKVVSAEAGNQYGHQVLPNPDGSGGGYVFWLSDESTTGDIYGQYFDSTGAPLMDSPGGEEIANNGTAIQDFKVISADNSMNGEAIVVFRLTNNTVRALRVNSTGGNVWGGVTGSDLFITTKASSEYSVVRNNSTGNYSVGYIEGAAIASVNMPKVKVCTIGGGSNRYSSSPLQSTSMTSTGYQAPAQGISQGIGPALVVSSNYIGPLVEILNAGGVTGASTSGTYNDSLDDVTLHLVCTTGGNLDGSAQITVYDDAAHTNDIGTLNPVSGAPIAIPGTGVNVTFTGTSLDSTGPDEWEITLDSSAGEFFAVTGDYNNTWGNATLHFVVITAGPMDGTARVRVYRDAAHTLTVGTYNPVSGSSYALGASGLSFSITDPGPPAGGILLLGNEVNVPVGTAYGDACTRSATSVYSGSYGPSVVFTLEVITPGAANNSDAVVRVTYDNGGGSTFIADVTPNDGTNFSIGTSGISVNITDGTDNWLYDGDTWTINANTSAYTDTVAVNAGPYALNENGSYRVWVSTGGSFYSGSLGSARLSYAFTPQNGTEGGATVMATGTMRSNIWQPVDSTNISIRVTDGGDEALIVNDVVGTFQVSDRVRVSTTTTYDRVDVADHSTAATADFFAVCSNSAGLPINASCWNTTTNTATLHTQVWSVASAGSGFSWANTAVADQLLTAYSADTCYLLAHNTGLTSIGAVRLDDTGTHVIWSRELAGRDPHMVLDQTAAANERILLTYRNAAGTAIQAGTIASASGAYTGYTLTMPSYTSGNTNTVPRVILADNATTAASPFFVTWFGYNGVNYLLYSSGFNDAGAVQWSSRVYPSATAPGSLRHRGLYYNDSPLSGSMTNGILPVWVEGADLFYEQVDGNGSYKY